MIHNYGDHAANERTFLAWVRTGVAVTAFGFVIEKFNLFMLMVATSTVGEGVHRLQFQKLSGSVGRYDGLAPIFGGVALVVLAVIRFVRTTWLLDDPQEHFAKSVRVEVIISAVLILLVAGYSLYLALD